MPESTIPADIRRRLIVESGFMCSMPYCRVSDTLDVHHINGNRNDHNIENLILLCANHHRMATAGRIDRKACKMMKDLLTRKINYEDLLSREFATLKAKVCDIEGDVIKLSSRVHRLEHIPEPSGVPQAKVGAEYLTITCFGVGRGDSIAMKFVDGSTGLIDCCTGPDSSTPPVLEFLRSSEKKTRFLCLTHPHQDHWLGMSQVLEDNSICVDEFWHTIPELATFLQWYNTRSVRVYKGMEPISFLIKQAQGELLDVFWSARERKLVRIPSTCSSTVIGESVLVIVGPSDDESSRFSKGVARSLQDSDPRSSHRSLVDANILSPLIVVKHGKNKILFGGDLPIHNLLQRIDHAGNALELPVDAVIVPGHGRTWNRTLRDKLLPSDHGLVCVSGDGSIHGIRRDRIAQSLRPCDTLLTTWCHPDSDGTKVGDPEGQWPDFYDLAARVQHRDIVLQVPEDGAIVSHYKSGQVMGS